MKKLINSKNGMTLVELLVSLLIFSTIALMIGTVFTPTLRMYDRANDLAEINLLLDNLSDEMLDDLSCATSITGDSASVRINNHIEYSVVGGILCRNGSPVFDGEYYKNKTVAMTCSYLDNSGASSSGAAIATVTVRLVLFDSGGEMGSRDYVVRPLGLAANAY